MTPNDIERERAADAEQDERERARHACIDEIAAEEERGIWRDLADALHALRCRTAHRRIASDARGRLPGEDGYEPPSPTSTATRGRRQRRRRPDRDAVCRFLSPAPDGHPQQRAPRRHRAADLASATIPRPSFSRPASTGAGTSTAAAR